MKLFSKITSVAVSIGILLSCSSSFSLAAGMNTENIVTLNETTNYENMAEAVNWEEPSDTPYTTVLIDNYLTVSHTDEGGLTDKTRKIAVIRNNLGGIIGEDTYNGTYVTSNQLNGKYKIEISCEGKTVRKNETNPFYYLELMTGDTMMVMARIRPLKVRFMNSTGESGSTITPTDYDATIENSVGEYTLVFEIDTESGKVECTVDDGESAAGSVANGTKGKPVTAIRLQAADRFRIDSYFKIKNIKITQISLGKNESLKEMLDKLPEKLVEDIDSVTDDIDTSKLNIDGVTWESSDTDIITDDGKVTRSKDSDKQVSMTAKFTIDGAEYTKVYNMTVAQSKNVVKYYVDGQKVNEEEVSNGNKAKGYTPDIPEHYAFAGWYEQNSDVPFDFDTELYDHVNLYAKFEPAEYTVTFDDGAVKTQLTGKYGSTVTGNIPDITPKSGYTSGSWKIENTNTTFYKNTVITGNITVVPDYKQGTEEPYTVIYKANGSEYASEKVYSGNAPTLPPAPSKDNYTFVKWQNESDGTEFDDDVVINGDVVTNAVFEGKKISVTFYDDDKTTKIYDGVGYYNSPYGKLPPAPEKDGGFTFAGWKIIDNDSNFDENTVVTEPISLYATYVSTRKVILDYDLTEIKTRPQAEKMGWTFASTAHTNAGVSDTGGILISQKTSTPAANSTTANNTRETTLGGILEGYLETDDANRSKTAISRLLGTVQVDLTINKNIITPQWPDDYTGTKSTPYATLHVGGTSSNDGKNLTTGPITYRIQPTSIIAINSSSTSSATINKTWSCANGEDVTIHLIADTVNNVVKTWVGDDESSAVSGRFYTSSNYFNAMMLETRQSFGVDSTILFKHIKITQIESDEENQSYLKCMDMLDKLPDSLTTDPYNVTDDITIPEVVGVTWSSSEPSIITNKGKVTRWYDDMDVTISAIVGSGNYLFTKKYELIVKKRNDLEEQEKVDAEFTSENSVNEWVLDTGGINCVEYSSDSNGFKVRKITSGNDLSTSKEKRVSNAFFDLYGTETAYNDESRSHTLSKDYSGVYDISLSALGSIKSKAPATISVGYRDDNVFRSAGTFKFSADGLQFVYNNTAEITTKVELSSDVSKFSDLRLRIDTKNGYIWLFNGGVLINNEAYEFYNNFPEGNDFIINSIRVGMDDNNESGDYLTIKNVNVKQLLPSSISGKKSVLDAAALLTVYDICNNPGSAEGTLKELPSVIGDGYSVEWSTHSNQIDLETGKIYHDNTENNVVLSAYISDKSSEVPVVIRKDFYLTVRAAQNPEYTEYEIYNVGTVTNQPYDDIRYDLELPYLEGAVWSSSNTSIITDNGKINRDILQTTDVPVTMTVSKNGVSKEYKLTVKKHGDMTVLSDSTGNFELNGYTGLKVTGDIVVNLDFTFDGSEGQIDIVNSYGGVVASAVVTESGIWFDYDGTDGKIYPKHNGDSVSVKIYAIPSVGCIAIWIDGVCAADYVRFYGGITDIAGIKSNISNVAVNTEVDAYTLLRLNADNLPYFDVLDTGYINSDINLSGESITGATVKWATSNTSVMDSVGNVTNPEILTPLTVTLTLTDAENVSISYVKNIYVDCEESRNILNGKSVSLSSLEVAQNPKININDGSITTLCEIYGTNIRSSYIAFDMEKNKSFNTVYVGEQGKAIEGYVVSISDDGKTWSDVKRGNLGNSQSGLIQFENTVTSRFVRFTVEKCDASSVFIGEIKAYMIADYDELAKIDIDLISVPASTESDLTLPAVGENGTLFEWTSSNNSVIDANGRVTRPTNGTVVTLTVKAVGTDLTKGFEVYVKGKSNVISSGGGSGAGGGMNFSENSSGGNYIGSVQPGDTYTAKDAEVISTGIYADVPDNEWYAPYIKTLTEKGIVSGDGSGYFYPQNNVTREQFVKMLVLAAGEELTEDIYYFDDVNMNAWYVPYVMTAKNTGIIQGITETTFGVGEKIIRQDMAVMITRILKSKGVSSEISADKFLDESSISEYAYDSVYFMKGLDLIEGYDRLFNPHSYLTKAEAAKVVVSLMDYIENTVQ